MSDAPVIMSDAPVIELRDIEKSFGGRRVLDGFSLTVAPGAKLSLVGESSCGKSSLLKIIVGLIRPDQGAAKVFGRDLNRISSRELRAVRQRIGMQFQSGALFDSLSVIENLKLARRESARDEAALRRADDREELMELLAAVGLAKAADRAPHALSGGMRKRAALARAIAVNPDLAIFDEPTAGLDPVTSRRIINLIERVSSRSGAAMILATTDVQVARHFSPDLVIMNQGRLWAQGAMDALEAGADLFTKKLLSRLL
ncbi:MAG: ATP-binding cassette domain-containing protein [Candidatus Adiutrix sp.]|jgi:phospholipid/cholesterol/gamma-HCH transport system ATP-binding protein|nr:ATP-binding cassette domain-containing protein [Candidatus Adiutrix sp.]